MLLVGLTVRYEKDIVILRKKASEDAKTLYSLVRSLITYLYAVSTSALPYKSRRF